MSKIKIVTDSNSGISQKEAKELGISIVPMPFTINGEEYFEDINVTYDEFFNFLKQNADVKTSQPSQNSLETIWEEALKENDEVLFIPMTSGLSATCENAKSYAKKYNGKVVVVDNLRISVLLKECVYEALEMVKLGKTATEIKDYLEATKKYNSIYIVPSTLKYLKRGGRISRTSAALGELLNLKPILATHGGSFEKAGIAISTNLAKKKMIKLVQHDLENDFKEYYEQGKMCLAVAHTQNFEEAEKFKEEIKKALPKCEFRFVDQLSLSISCHIGPGAVAIGTYVKNY